MRSIPAFCLYVFLLCAGSAFAQEERIAAIVNDDVVSLNDLEARETLEMRSSGIPDTPENRQHIASQVLRSLIDERLEMQEAKHQGVSVSKEEVNQSLARIEQQNNMPKGGLDAFLAKAGISRASLVDQITAGLTWAKLVRNRLSQDVNISDEEVDDSLARLKQESNVPQDRVSEIFLAVDNPTQEPEVKALADKLIEQIRSGIKFDALARQFSQSPTAAVGGDLGWITPDQLLPELGKALDKMNPGEMSYPLHAGGGYYVLYLVSRRTLGAPNPADTQVSLVEVVLPLQPGTPPDVQQRALLHAQQISGEVKSCGELAKVGRDEAPQTSREIPDIKAGELPQNVRQAVLSLAVAQASKPLVVPGGIGVVMVCQKKDPAGGLPTREEIADALARQRLDALARAYLDDLRRGAYVDIRG
ncbi:MAG TPA: peptidylprolyl isomerase [Stellaceae bacterium]|nr:peptidylprolyl isomerase [Stellaceae bacterium]